MVDVKPFFEIDRIIKANPNRVFLAAESKSVYLKSGTMDMKSLVLSMILIFTAFKQDGVEELLLGKWNYTKGSYEYYDAADHKLKESAMNAFDNLEIQLSKDNVAVISFSKTRSKSTTYSVTKSDNGKYTINTNLSGNPVKYEIATINDASLVLLSKTNASFFLDGDVNKKVSYCLIRIYLEKKPSGL